MNNIHLKSKQEFEEFLKTHVVKRLGVGGREGECSLLDNGYVIKKLYKDYYPQFALQFKDIDIPSFIFAKAGIIVDEFVVALLMEYAEGKILNEHRPTDQRIITLGEHLDTLVGDIKLISGKGVYVTDFHCGNIVYDYNRFRIIDTLPYLLMPTCNFEKANIYEIMNRLFDGILDDIMHFGVVRREIGYRGKIERLENPKEYLLALKGFLEDLSGQRIDTLDEAKLTLTRKFNN